MIRGVKLLDNSSDVYQMVTAIRSMLADDNISQISIATGYWDLPGMVLVFEDLQQFLRRKNTVIRLLLGEEPYVKAYQIRNPVMPDPDFPGRYIKRDLEETLFKPEYQSVVEMLCRYMNADNTGQIQVKVYRQNFLHAKCYIFGSDSENAMGIVGSSNFTRQGLFGNLELNQLEDNNSTVNFVRKDVAQHPSHRSWFEDLWQQSEDWSQVFREEVLLLSKHGTTCFSPYEMYIHALYRIYGQEMMDEQENNITIDAPDSGKPQLLTFQVQNANSLIKKLERQGVAMLSDSVGLGKTYTAIKVIEHYMFDPQKNQRVVVIAPAGLISQWRSSINDFQLKHVPEIYSLQDITRIEDVRNNLKSIPVGLFVFDESHNLRSMGGQRFEAFIKWKQDNPNARTLLVTATPINNQLHDLTSQIILASGGEIFKLGKFFDRQRQRSFTIQERLELIQSDIKKQIRENDSVDYPHLKEQLTPLLNKFIVRRTRQGIEKEYPDGLEINGKNQKFPHSYPNNLEYQVPNQYKSKLLDFASTCDQLTGIYKFDIESLAEMEYLAHPFDLAEHYSTRDKPIDSTLEIVYSGLLSLGFPCYRYNIYQWRYYRKKRGELKLNADENRDLSRQIGIYGIFRTVFLKRLESSLYSINKSILGYEKKLLDFQDKLERFNKIISVKNLAALNKAVATYNEQRSSEDELDFDIDTFEANEDEFVTIDAQPGVFHVEKMKEDIMHDLTVIHILKQQIGLLIKKDDKLQELAKHLNQNDDRKVLVFTYFADTLEYLSENLPQYLVKGKHIGFALGTKSDIEHFAGCFAPIAKKYTLKGQDKELDYLIATDKLSEGQNLQDCGMIVNYDLHWNPVRMIQRNGRINRIGTPFEEIFIYNFRPTEQLESYLKLIRKLEEKINLIRYTIGSDQSVLDEEPIPQDFTEDLYSRDEKKRMAAFQRIFETSELLAAEDLFMDDLREFDRNEEYSQLYKDQIKHIPKGKWGRVQMRKDNDHFTHLAHLAAGHDDPPESGCFVGFYKNGIAEMFSTAEGLLSIKATSDNNQRFHDPFQDKVRTEALINEYILTHQFSEEVHKNRYNIPQEESIMLLRNKMFQYGYPFEVIEKVHKCILHSQNAYINRESIRLVREMNRKIRRNEHVGDELIEKFIELAAYYNPDEKTVNVTLSEIIQIFC